MVAVVPGGRNIRRQLSMSTYVSTGGVSTIVMPPTTISIWCVQVWCAPCNSGEVWSNQSPDDYSVQDWLRDSLDVNTNSHNDLQGILSAHVHPFWIMFGNWTWKRFQCVSFVFESVWCDPLEVSRMDSVSSYKDYTGCPLKLFLIAVMRTQPSLPCTHMMLMFVLLLSWLPNLVSHGSMNTSLETTVSI